MKEISVLISAEAKGAYFGEYLKVAQSELSFCFGVDAEHQSIGSMDFLKFSCPESELEQISRLSFVHGMFERLGDSLSPLAYTPTYFLHEDFVFGSKFRGKTNERLSQMLLNISLASVEKENPKILDPMCGRATTLLWALRYGLDSKGIEQDSKAVSDISQICKKWKKVHGEKISFHDGFVQKKNKRNEGKFLEVKSTRNSFKVITGDSKDSAKLLQGEMFDAIISDLPYGIQHHASFKTRNPLHLLESCAPVWTQLLSSGGVITLAYNRYLPKRNEMLHLFEKQGLEILDFQGSHRMSESIVRDVVVFRKSKA